MMWHASTSVLRCVQFIIAPMHAYVNGCSPSHHLRTCPSVGGWLDSQAFTRLEAENSLTYRVNNSALRKYLKFSSS